MRNLWKHILPFRADTFGFREVANNTDGFGLMDDCTNYHGGGATGGRRGIRDFRFNVSKIRNEDVISGTKEKILKRVPLAVKDFSPKFILLGSAPAASMIGTDYGDVVNAITEMTGLPAAYADVTGHKTYDCGISVTLEAMAKLLIKEGQAVSKTMNLVGGTALDWGQAIPANVQAWCRNTGMELISVWGARETSANYQRAAEASVNLVATTSGLRMAKWMQTQFGTPYIAAAPFGKSWSAQIQEALSTHVQPTAQPKEGGPSAVFIGEQMMGNAFRATLQMDYGFDAVKVYSYFTMDKEYMLPGDKKLRSEDDLAAALAENEGCTIIGSPLYRYYKPDSCRWIDLPCPGFLAPADEMPALVGKQLNDWLDQVLV